MGQSAKNHALCFLIFLLFLTPRIWACSEQTYSDIEKPIAPGPLGKKYFVYLRQFGDGTLPSVTESLAKFKQLNIDIIWLSPVHPQTTLSKRGIKNDHGYWWRDPSEVSKELGGWQAFTELVKTAKAMQIEICLDTVLDHAGYSDVIRRHYQKDDGSVIDEQLSTKDPENFRTEYLSSNVYNRIDDSQNPQSILQALNELSRYVWDPELPVLKHVIDNPQGQLGLRQVHQKNFEWLYYSYRKFVDAGVRVFRIDAPKHIPFEFLVKFVNELNQYSQQRYHESLKFIFEYLVPHYQTLDTIAAHLTQQIKDAKVYFYDFPKAFEIRRLISTDDPYDFSHFKEFIAWRENGNHHLQHYVPIIEDHDALTPIRDQFDSLMLHVISGFFSHHATVLFHGGEIGGNRQQARTKIADINPDGKIGDAVKKLSDFLTHYKWTSEFEQSTFHVAQGDHLVVEKKINGSKIYLVVNRSTQPLSVKIPIENTDYKSLDTILNDGDHISATIQNTGQVLELSAPPKSVAVFHLHK